MNKLKEMEGQEIWTDVFGERMCVGVKYPYCISGERLFKPSKKQVEELWADLMRSEFGGKEQMMADLEKEFGGDVE